MMKAQAGAALAALMLLPAAGLSVARAADFRVTPMSVPNLKAVFGEVESRNVIPARARIGGTVSGVAVSEGTEVKEGQVIARVTDDKLALQLSAAEAKIREVRSQLDNARTEMERAQQLLARGIAPQSRVDQARTLFEVATNQLTAAEADRAVIAQRAKEGEVLAPASGRVLTVPVTVGSVILPGEEIARIASGQYYLRLSLPERHAAQIRQGDEVRIGQRGLSGGQNGPAGTLRTGRIVKVYPEIRNGRVIADVDVAGLGDYFVNERTLVWIPVGQRETLAVPPAAIATRHGVDYARLKAANDSVAQGGEEVAVITGETIETPQGPRIEVLTGLHAGDVVAVPETSP